MYGGLITFFKFILAIVLLPVIIAVTVSFHQELATLKHLKDVFGWGITAYVICHFFVYVPLSFHQFGQRIVSGIFRFDAGLSSVIPLFLPIIPIILLLILYLNTMTWKVGLLAEQFIFFLGFTLAMHVILIAKNLYAEDSNPIKTHYVFIVSLAYIFNIFIIVLLLDLNFTKFSFMTFFDTFMDKTKHICNYIYQQLLAVRS